MVIDEIDTLISRRTDSNQTEVGKQIKNLLLEYTDGVSTLPGIFVIGTTNHPESIDTAFLDRCTMITKMSLPNDDAKFQFMKNFLAKENIEHNTATVSEHEHNNVQLQKPRKSHGHSKKEWSSTESYESQPFHSSGWRRQWWWRLISSMHRPGLQM